MPETARLALPYPAGTDPADVPADLGALATALDSVAIDDQGLFADRPVSTPGTPGIRGRFYWATDQGILYRDHGTGWTAFVPRPTVVDELPASPSDGQVALLSPGMDASDPVFTAVFRNSSGVWHVAGGSAFATDTNVTSPPPVVLANSAIYGTAGLSLIAPWAGRYRVRVEAEASIPGAGSYAVLSYQATGADNTPSAMDLRSSSRAIGGGYEFLMGRTTEIDLAAGATVTMYRRAGAANVSLTLEWRQLTIWPLYLNAS